MKHPHAIGKGHQTSTPNLPVIRPWTPPVQLPGLEPDAMFYKMGKCLIIVGHSEHGAHLSISHPDRYPTWDEIAKARYTLLPNELNMAIMLPPAEDYVAFHNNCFHLWQIPVEYARDHKG